MRRKPAPASYFLWLRIAALVPLVLVGFRSVHFGFGRDARAGVVDDGGETAEEDTDSGCEEEEEDCGVP